MSLLMDYKQCDKCQGIEWVTVTVGNIPLIKGEPIYALENARLVFRCKHCGEYYEIETP